MVDRVVTVRPEISKVRRRRFVHLTPNAARWLEEYSLRGGSVTGLVVPFTRDVLLKKRIANRKAAGVERWPNSAMRHSYCSYHLAAFGDIDRLVIQSGHSSVTTMWENYHHGVKKSVAEEFWQIVPLTTDEKIVRFEAAAGS